MSNRTQFNFINGKLDLQQLVTNLSHWIQQQGFRCQVGTASGWLSLTITKGGAI